MGIIIAIILGGLAGWIASKLLYRDAEQGVLLNVVVGIVGAFIANVFLAPLFGITSDLTSLNLGSFLLAVGGAIILLAIVNLFTRGRVR